MMMHVVSMDANSQYTCIYIYIRIDINKGTFKRQRIPDFPSIISPISQVGVARGAGTGSHHRRARMPQRFDQPTTGWTNQPPTGVPGAVG